MTHKTPARTALSLSVLALLVTGAALYAGPLNPPAGPVAPTLKTLTEVEPRIAINLTNTPGDNDSLFKITQPGSYYLTGNITGVVGKHGIEIAASGVTLDLNGFDLVGVPGMGAFDGVSVVNGGVGNVTVRNGSVRNWGDEGIDLSIALISRIDGVLATANLGNGIHVGNGGTVSNCTAFSNSGDGIANGSSCVVSNCAVFDNSGVGIRASIGTSSITECLVSGNAGGGISVGNHCTIARCTVRGNALDGILCASACLIVDNLCADNGSGASVGAGIRVTGSDNRI